MLILEIYLFSIPITWCLMMAGNTMLKNEGVIPYPLPMGGPSFILSFFPVLNILSAWSTLLSAWWAKTNPERRQRQKEVMWDMCQRCGWDKKYGMDANFAKKEPDSTDESDRS